MAGEQGLVSGLKGQQQGSAPEPSAAWRRGCGDAGDIGEHLDNGGTECLQGEREGCS